MIPDRLKYTINYDALQDRDMSDVDVPPAYLPEQMEIDDFSLPEQLHIAASLAQKRSAQNSPKAISQHHHGKATCGAKQVKSSNYVVRAPSDLPTGPRGHQKGSYQQGKGYGPRHYANHHHHKSNRHSEGQASKHAKLGNHTVKLPTEHERGNHHGIRAQPADHGSHCNSNSNNKRNRR